MTTLTAAAISLATRLHAPDGGRRADDEAARELKGAARAFALRWPGALSGAPTVTSDGALALQMTSAAALVDAMLSLAASLRDDRPTFCGAVVRLQRPAEAVEMRLVAQSDAFERALAGLPESDPRGPRVVMLLPDPDPVLGALLDLLLSAHDEMTARQRQVVSLVRESETQQAVARHLNVSRQAVNQSLAAAGWPLLLHAESVVRARLERAAGKTPLAEL
ncbi:MAG: hypothetical protein FJY74_01855 [Candidatus Eisenbacteria bacterium]|nr:hypothetical protein [Candidatus Eisenbacteria bacterium]